MRRILIWAPIALSSVNNSRVEAFSAPSMSAANPIAFSSGDAMNDCISRAQVQHDLEFKSGDDVFGTSLSRDNQENDHVVKWSDDNFNSYSVGKGNGGPSESVLENGHLIFEAKEAVMDESKCEFFIRMAKETIERERLKDDELDERDQDQPTNSELGEARLSKLPSEALIELRSILQDTLYPMLTDRFGMEHLTVYDGLILGSIAPSRSQPVHRDASLLTLNIALSSPDNFEAGGTYIEGLQNHDGQPLRIDRGKVLCHSSGIMHAGTAITSGERWVLVLFVIAKDEPQIARRTHAQGLEFLHSNALNEAKLEFEAGLNAAPNDHLLHMGLGQIASMKGDEKESLNRLTKASMLYPASHKAGMAAGKMLEAKRRPRAALRRFDEVLSRIDGKDLVNGAWMPLKALAWDARTCAGRCALLCAEYEAGTKDWSVRERTWTKKHLPVAIERFRAALVPVPGDGYIQSMLARAEELLADANDFPGDKL
jgi:tetratricopeptide (TPR) repeat protein